MNLKLLLERLVRNRYKDDLHSAMCKFKSGRTAYICSGYDKSIFIIIRDEDISIECSTIPKALEVFKNDELIDYEI